MNPISNLTIQYYKEIDCVEGSCVYDGHKINFKFKTTEIANVGAQDPSVNITDELISSFITKKINLDKGWGILKNTIHLRDTSDDFLSQEKQTAIHRFVYHQFFRRTSKLGIDFAINRLGGKVYFNISGAVDNTSSKPEERKTIEQGILIAATREQDIKRPITVSELRHVAKLVREGHINPSLLQLYDET